MNARIFLSAVLLFIFTGCGSSKKTTSEDDRIIVIDDGSVPQSFEQTEVSASTTSSLSTPAAKKYHPLQIKYAKYTRTTPAKITNYKLYSFIDNWLHTPYLWGGMDKRGIDCSAFVQKLIEYVYDLNLPRTSLEQFYANWIELYKSQDNLAEGDLVFFRTIPNTEVSHIGFYLKNRMFVNSSSSKGVSIASMDEPYWRKTYVASGRIKPEMLNAYYNKNR